MVWQEGVQVIVMVTKCQEDGKVITNDLKEPSPIFSNFFPTFGDSGITRKLVFSHNPCEILWLKSVAFGRYNEKVSGYGNHNH